MGVHVLLEDMSFMLTFLERIHVFKGENVLWMAYLKGGYALLKDMSYRKTGFTDENAS